MANTNQKLRMLLEAERAKSASLQATLEKQANDYALLQKKLKKVQKENNILLPDAKIDLEITNQRIKLSYETKCANDNR